MSDIFGGSPRRLSDRKLLQKKLRPFETPSNWMGAYQTSTTLLIYAFLVGSAFYFVHANSLLLLAFLTLGGLTLTRLFVLQHDCGHRTLFQSPRANDWVGWALGVITLTPILNWRYVHNLHHAGSGNLDDRSKGDIWILTVSEYKNSSPLTKLCYRLYRNPLLLFFLGPVFYFVFRRRFAVKLPAHLSRERRDILYTNMAICLIWGSLIYFLGLRNVLTVMIPIAAIGSSLGVWLFYIQHTFEDAYFETNEDWNFEKAALTGSSFYKLPAWLNWFTADIAYHHIHHLNPRIPNYRLKACHEAVPEVAPTVVLGFWESLSNAQLRLWDETTKQMVPGYP